MSLIEDRAVIANLRPADGTSKDRLVHISQRVPLPAHKARIVQ